MNRLRDYVQNNPIARLEERGESWVVRIEKQDASFLVTIPTTIHELFWEVTVENKKIFEDWSEYYEGTDDERREDKVTDSIKVLDAMSKAESVRVKVEGKFLKIKKLMILRNRNWTDLSKEIEGEPVG